MQCYKAVPALCVHMLKRTPAAGPGRLHVLRVLDAIVGKALHKHGTDDKYSAPLRDLAHTKHTPPVESPGMLPLPDRHTAVRGMQLAAHMVDVAELHS